MAQKISGNYYKVEWDETNAEWVGYVTGMNVDGKVRNDMNVRVKTHDDLEQVLLTVVHHLDDLVEDVRE